MNIKTIIFTISVFFTLNSFSGVIKFQGPCSQDILFKENFKLKEDTSLYDLTLSSLNKNKIPYSENRMGINSIFETPIGSDGIEILGPEEMRIFGWCYKVNDKILYEIPQKIIISKNDSSNILWYFAYAHFLDGTWISQCEESWKNPPVNICSSFNQGK